MHSEISILYPFDGIIISVDSGMQEILTSFWSIGIETFSSCENNKGFMSITFELDEYLKFLRLIHSYGLDAMDSKYFDICCRIRGQTQPCSILDAWRIMINAVGIPTINIRFQEEDYVPILNLIAELIYMKSLVDDVLAGELSGI